MWPLSWLEIGLLAVIVFSLVSHIIREGIAEVHKHTWKRQTQYFPPYPDFEGRVNAEMFEKILYGWTQIKWVCEECGEVKIEERIGDHREVPLPKA